MNYSQAVKTFGPKHSTNICKNNYTHICHFCGGNHICKECPIEKQIAPELKKEIGKKMELYVSKFINCPHCKKKKFTIFKL